MSFENKLYTIAKNISERNAYVKLLVLRLFRLYRWLKKSRISAVILLAPYLPAVVLMRALRPLIAIKLCRLHSLKLGHYAINTEIHLCQLDKYYNTQSKRPFLIYFNEHSIICNQQLYKMWKRIIRIYPRALIRPIFLLNRALPGGESHNIDIRSSSGRDVEGLLEKSSPHIRLSDEEESFGAETLKLMGLPLGANFVIVNFRDSAYFDYLLGSGKDARDHYRNADINSFSLAAEELSNRGYYVIRCGAKVECSFSKKNPMIIDYASSPWRSDLMDIYLGSKCSFAVSTGTGWDEIPSIFRKPVCYVNYCPVSHLPTYNKNDFILTKNHYDESEEGNLLSLRQIFRSSAHTAFSCKDFKSAKIILKDNTAEELLDLVIEVDEKVIRRVKSTNAETALQERFRSIFKECLAAVGQSDLHGELRASYSEKFLSKNPSWLD